MSPPPPAHTSSPFTSLDLGCPGTWVVFSCGVARGWDLCCGPSWGLVPLVWGCGTTVGCSSSVSQARQARLGFFVARLLRGGRGHVVARGSGAAAGHLQTGLRAMLSFHQLEHLHEDTWVSLKKVEGIAMVSFCLPVFKMRLFSKFVVFRSLQLQPRRPSSVPCCPVLSSARCFPRLAALWTWLLASARPSLPCNHGGASSASVCGAGGDSQPWVPVSVSLLLTSPSGQSEAWGREQRLW